MSRPQAGRPEMPGYGIAAGRQGMLSWKWAEELLRASRRYWLVTTGAGRPHAMPLWGLWLGNAFYCSTGKRSQKARNLAKNARCAVCVEKGGDAVVVEGTASRVRAAAVRRRFNAAYKKKYKWDLESWTEPVFVVRPRKVFGLREGDFTKSATRWT
ncbi:MAG: pyridoxamine 5'-phosphate oxidase family protein, partial [Terriglobales bacterium]